MELATPGDGKWFLAGSYEYHDVSELVSGSSSVPDTTGRDRTSEALILETSRGLFGKLSFSALVSVVNHERTVGGYMTAHPGVGDAVAMMKYSPSSISLYSRNAFSLGVGARLPIGEDDATSDGIVLAEDMQPSTGAFGGIFWLYAARALNESASVRLYSNATYANNGENDRAYHFGNETSASFGVSYQTQSAWGFNAELLYRHTDRDQRIEQRYPIPAVNGWISCPRFNIT